MQFTTARQKNDPEAVPDNFPYALWHDRVSWDMDCCHIWKHFFMAIRRVNNCEDNFLGGGWRIRHTVLPAFL